MGVCRYAYAHVCICVHMYATFTAPSRPNPFQAALGQWFLFGPSSHHTATGRVPGIRIAGLGWAYDFSIVPWAFKILSPRQDAPLFNSPTWLRRKPKAQSSHMPDRTVLARIRFSFSWCRVTSRHGPCFWAIWTKTAFRSPNWMIRQKFRIIWIITLVFNGEWLKNWEMQITRISVTGRCVSLQPILCNKWWRKMVKSWRNSSHHLLGACFGAQIEVLQEPIALLERAVRGSEDRWKCNMEHQQSQSLWVKYGLIIFNFKLSIYNHKSICWGVPRCSGVVFGCSCTHTEELTFYKTCWWLEWPNLFRWSYIVPR